MDFLIRCSSIYKIMGEPKKKSESLTDTAKTYLRELARENVFGFNSFEGNKYTQKGIMLEGEAIRLSGRKRLATLKKHQGRFTKGLVTGECDIWHKPKKLIIDTKCSWDIGTHPFFVDEALDKVKKAGYDYQMQGYMYGYDADVAEIDFCLLPTPEELLSPYDDKDKFITAVQNIPISKRCMTVRIERDEAIISKILEKAELAKSYYDEITKDIIKVAS